VVGEVVGDGVISGSTVATAADGLALSAGWLGDGAWVGAPHAQKAAAAASAAIAARQKRARDAWFK
jgi:hypothetical protein